MKSIHLGVCVAGALGVLMSAVLMAADDPSPPALSLKLVFVHHSCGENWLSDEDGGLGIALRDSGYFVSDTNYGWGPVCEDCEGCWGAIGDCTDIVHWDKWFNPLDAGVFEALITEYGQSCSYSRADDPDPTRENEIVMFKSCYPNSNLARSGDGSDAGQDGLTVGRAQQIYDRLLGFFAAHQDKLFIAITAPPVCEEDSWVDPANARAFNDWLVYEWLAEYPFANVAVFDFYNVLTSSGGDPYTNDAGEASGNHHRWWEGAVQHQQSVDMDLAAYASGDSHPTAAGNQKATQEFVPLLNVYANRWAESRSED